MRHSMRDPRALKIPLQIENVFANVFDIAMLLFGNPPNQNMQLATVARKISGYLFADERSRQMCNFEAPSDRIVICNGDVIHSALAQLFIQLRRIGIAVGKIESAKKPFFRARTMARVDV